jgi:pilus assembly protein Flp/PilA
MATLRKFFVDNHGATAVEYGLILAILSAAVVAGFGAYTGALQDVFAGLAGVFSTP